MRRMLKLARRRRVTRMRELWHVLAEADIPDFAFVDQFLEGLPSRIRVLCELFVVYRTILVQGERPVDDVEVKIINAERFERNVKGLFNVFWGVEDIPELSDVQ